MKKKFLLPVLAGILAFSTLTACTDSDKSVSFSEYWQKDSLNPGTVEETLTYAVTFEKGAGYDATGYLLSYGEGHYQTNLKSTTQGYAYTTELTMPVSYTLGSETKEFTDTVTTSVLFERTSLLPIASTKTVVSHSPTNAQAKTVADCYVAYEYTVETTYADGTGKSKVVYRETEDVKALEQAETSFQYKKGDYSYLDNEQLLLALRAISSTTTTGSIKSYAPTEDSMQKIKFTFEEATGKEFNHTVNGASLSDKNISYRPVTLQRSANNPGTTQTAWIATTPDPSNNLHRNVLLKLETPLAYNLGKLVYTLTAVTNIH